jgi:hypothetical protein
MSKHTKGPWHVGTGNGEGSVFANEDTPYARMRLDKGITTLYPICSVTRGWNDAEDAANARLIASAPELFACLKQVLGSHGELDDALWNRIRNAVADACGDAA